MTDAELYAAAIEASGLSARQFAMCLLARDERTGRRWLEGDPLPERVREWCEKWLELSDDTRGRIVRALGP